MLRRCWLACSSLNGRVKVGDRDLKGMLMLDWGSLASTGVMYVRLCLLSFWIEIAGTTKAHWFKRDDALLMGSLGGTLLYLFFFSRDE